MLRPAVVGFLFSDSSMFHGLIRSGDPIPSEGPRPEAAARVEGSSTLNLLG
jgi:hypothetical protein